MFASTIACFMGTDVGLRFKSTRGRGGVVEKISISNIQMTDIADRRDRLQYVLRRTGADG